MDEGMVGQPGNRTLIAGLQDRSTPVVLAAHGGLGANRTPLPGCWNPRCPLDSSPKKITCADAPTTSDFPTEKLVGVEN